VPPVELAPPVVPPVVLPPVEVPVVLPAVVLPPVEVPVVLPPVVLPPVEVPAALPPVVSAPVVVPAAVPPVVPAPPAVLLGASLPGVTQRHWSPLPCGTRPLGHWSFGAGCDRSQSRLPLGGLVMQPAPSQAAASPRAAALTT
jgi:hypothetical protein